MTPFSRVSEPFMTPILTLMTPDTKTMSEIVPKSMQVMWTVIGRWRGSNHPPPPSPVGTVWPARGVLKARTEHRAAQAKTCQTMSR